MDIVKIVAIAIVCALLCAVLKQYKPEFAIVVQLAASVFILLLIASAMGDLISAVKDLINGSGINTEYLTLLLKALGVSVLTQLAADACRDSGETALSNKVELAGKVTILLLCLPLVKAMIQLSAGLIRIYEKISNDSDGIALICIINRSGVGHARGFHSKPTGSLWDRRVV